MQDNITENNTIDFLARSATVKEILGKIQTFLASTSIPLSEKTRDSLTVLRTFATAPDTPNRKKAFSVNLHNLKAQLEKEIKEVTGSPKNAGLFKKLFPDYNHDFSFQTNAVSNPGFLRNIVSDDTKENLPEIYSAGVALALGAGAIAICLNPQQYKDGSDVEGIAGVRVNEEHRGVIWLNEIMNHVEAGRGVVKEVYDHAVIGLTPNFLEEFNGLEIKPTGESAKEAGENAPKFSQGKLPFNIVRSPEETENYVAGVRDTFTKNQQRLAGNYLAALRNAHASNNLSFLVRKQLNDFYGKKIGTEKVTKLYNDFIESTKKPKASEYTLFNQSTAPWREPLIVDDQPTAAQRQNLSAGAAPYIPQPVGSNKQQSQLISSSANDDDWRQRPPSAASNTSHRSTGGNSGWRNQESNLNNNPAFQQQNRNNNRGGYQQHPRPNNYNNRQPSAAPAYGSQFTPDPAQEAIRQGLIGQYNDTFRPNKNARHNNQSERNNGGGRGGWK